jgi:MFS family permease
MLGSVSLPNTEPDVKNALLIATACLLGLLSTTGASLPYPILPPLFAGVGTAGAADGLTNFLGLPPKLLFAVALMVNPIGLLLGTAVLGSLSDRFGRRPLLLWTAAGAAVGHILTAWALAASPIRCSWRRASPPACWKARAPSCAPCWPTAWRRRCATMRCPG